VGRLVTESLAPLRPGQVRGDRDSVRRTVNDLAAGELPAREADPRRVELEPRREPVVEPLQDAFVVGFLERKEELLRRG
jgi:hypothetical protein